MLRKIVLSLILLTILVVNTFRFWKLDTVPHGYHVDEMGSAVTMQCFAQKGCDAELRPWPLFGQMEYGQDKPPTWVYPGILWVKSFGATVPSLRAYSVFGLMIGFVGLFFLAQGFLGTAFGLVVVLAATCSPWSWVVTRVALESYFAPVYAIWGLYFFWRSSRWWDWALAGFLFVCAMYTYPPARMQIPLMMISLVFYEWGRRKFRLSSVLSLITVFGVTLIPLVQQYIYGSLNRRFNDISIFNQDFLQHLGLAGNFKDLLQIFTHNYFLHLTPNFLFFTGDPSYVHSTRHLGILSWFDMAALLIFIVFIVLVFIRPAWDQNPVIVQRRWLIFLAANFFMGIIPSALTYQELPHALRICSSWIFMMLFSGFMWFSAASCIKAFWPMLVLTGILSSGVLVYQYFTIYPVESRGMFDFWIKDAADQCQTQEDWQKFIMVFHRRNYHCRYFMVQRMGMSCKEANDLWWQIFNLMIKNKTF